MPNKNTVSRQSKSEAKADEITETVKGMTEADTSAREAKTQRLRAARLARDETVQAQSVANPTKKAPKRSTKAKSAD